MDFMWVLTERAQFLLKSSLSDYQWETLEKNTHKLHVIYLAYES